MDAEESMEAESASPGALVHRATLLVDISLCKKAVEDIFSERRLID